MFGTPLSLTRITAPNNQGSPHQVYAFTHNNLVYASMSHIIIQGQVRSWRVINLLYIHTFEFDEIHTELGYED